MSGGRTLQGVKTYLANEMHAVSKRTEAIKAIRVIRKNRFRVIPLLLTDRISNPVTLPAIATINKCSKFIFNIGIRPNCVG
jgi:hypothetical protein